MHASRLVLLRDPHVTKAHSATLDPMANALETLRQVSRLPLDAWTIRESQECTGKSAAFAIAFFHEHVANARKTLKHVQAASTLLLFSEPRGMANDRHVTCF